MKWKPKFEKTWADDFDRAMIIQTVSYKMINTYSKCDVGIKWYSEVNTREYDILHNESMNKFEEKPLSLIIAMMFLTKDKSKNAVKQKENRQTEVQLVPIMMQIPTKRIFIVLGIS